MITIGLASIPERITYLKQVINRFNGERINVFLDGYDYVPDFLNSKKIHIFTSQAIGDVGDAGKFMEVPARGVYISCDDDLIYPEGYEDNIISGIKKHKCIVTYHGCNFVSPFESYYKSRVAYHFLNTVYEDTQVQIGGTGVMGFDSQGFRPLRSFFKKKNMSDIWISIMAMMQGVPIMCLKHTKGWIGQQKVLSYQTIYGRYHRNDAHQTELVKEHFNLTK